MAPASGPDDDDDGGGLGRALRRASEVFALAGGAVLLAVMTLTVVSVTGRTFFGSPVLGDFELVEVGCAVAIFAFLPYCQMSGGNVVVDIFMRGLGETSRRRLDALHSLVFALIAALFAWRLSLGGAELFAWGETTMILGLPMWLGFVPMVASSALLAAICLYQAAGGRGVPQR